MNIGVIAEERNDVDVLLELTNKLINPRVFSFKKFVAHGCGKLRNKCTAWANNLIQRGCIHLVVLHDLDTFSENALRNELTRYVRNIGFQGYTILIPIHEIEAWLLVDAVALQKVFSMHKPPRVPNRPEVILKPKEKLRDIIWKYSERRYINTIHNQKIARALQIKALNVKCPSFSPYPRFIKNMFK